MDRQIRVARGGKLVLTRLCTKCRCSFEVTVSKKGYREWLDGKMIQHALPTLTPDERELLISGTCGKCFDTMFGT